VTRKYSDEERAIALEKKKQKTKERNARPENVVKRKSLMSTPEWKEKRLAGQKKYSRTPEAKAIRKILESTPKFKEKHRIQSRLRYQNSSEVRAKIKKTTQERTTQFKLEVFTHYSKEISDSDVPICACCKYDDIRFLTLDHIEGRKHLPKKEQKLKTLNLWRHIKKIGLPKGYQILCFNCNIAKSTSLYCPHQLDRMNENSKS